MSDNDLPPPHSPIAEWLESWVPPGSFDQETGVHLGPSVARASFPDEGIGLFGDLDEESFWFVHRTSVILGELARTVGSNARILEVGSGSGAVASAMQGAGHEVMAIEPMSGGAVRARRRGVQHAFEGTLQEAQLPSNTFDCVGLFDVIEHLDDWAGVLLEAERVLKPSGCLMVTVPSYQWLWSEHDDWNEHKRRYSSAQLREALVSVGYDVEVLGYFFLPLIAPALGRRLLYLLLKRDEDSHEKRLREQLQPNQLVNRLLGSVLSLEERMLKRGVSIPTGTSVIATARPRSESPR